VTGGSTDGGPPRVAPPSASRTGERILSSGFEAEAASYLQQRLRLVTGIGGAFAAAFYVLAILAGDGRENSPLDLHMLIHAAATLSAAGLCLALSRRTFSPGALVAMDGAALAIPMSACVAIYALIYEEGTELVVPIAGLFLLARGVVVPSTARRTILFSAPAAPALLAVQLAHGTVYLHSGVPVPVEHFPNLLLWYHTYLALCVALAAVASHVNFGLRVKAYEAQKVGQYVLEQRIGAGAMGEVYRARHALLRRPTAIKFLRGELISSDTLRRFEREVRETSRLRHPNTVSIYDYGRAADGSFYYAMELLDGSDLERIVAETGPMPPARAIRILAEACRALAEAHELGLVHRDLKPGNIMLCRQGGEFDVVKVLDFGLVKDLRAEPPVLTIEGEICGTPQTISPEALSGQPVGPAADLYALGAVGCFLLTGRGIFDASTGMEFIGHHLHTEPIPPSARVEGVPADLEAVLLSCLRKDPGQRPAGARALHDALLRCADAGGWDGEAAAEWWRGRGAAFAPAG